MTDQAFQTKEITYNFDLYQELTDSKFAIMDISLYNCYKYLMNSDVFKHMCH